ncbi:MAG: hypothetical protein DRP78_03645 [Candidatus Omnitrophota bacterium]|nr:MAG: hypothetical protein DRP78_03645 [Candidatus Omnitrophota bacterium]
MALTSDDPLHLSNNKIYWEESPGLASWKPGNFNSLPKDFSQGFFDDSLAFFTRDSSGQRLTALRGISLDFFPDDQTSIELVTATPKTLWQEYSNTDTVASSLRVKHFLSDIWYIGMLSNLHL